MVGRGRFERRTLLRRPLENELENSYRHCTNRPVPKYIFSGRVLFGWSRAFRRKEGFGEGHRRTGTTRRGTDFEYRYLSQVDLLVLGIEAQY